jgi:hypothetical protein
MVDSRNKGRRGELDARDKLRKYTNLMWERTPMSGALDAKHKMKGDLYVPGKNIKYCVETKFYKDDHLTSKLITSSNPMLLQWWEQTVREAKQVDRDPLLIFKYNRSKWFAIFEDLDVYLEMTEGHERFLALHPEDIYISLLTSFCAYAEFEE